MKKNLSIFLYSSLFMLIIGSCKVDETIYDRETTETFLRGQGDVAPLVNGVYSVFYDGRSYRTVLHYLFNCWGPETYVPSSGPRGSSNTKSYDATNVYASLYPWASYYTIIRASNSLMARIEPVEMNADYKSRIIGEMYYMRAFAYFNLVRLYGKLPIFTENVISGMDLRRPRSSVDDVYALIFSDLKEAAARCVPIDKLPVAETGHATKGAAHGLLSSAYLTYGNYLDANNRSGKAREAYQMAVNYADTVLQSGKYALTPKFNDLFDITKENTQYALNGEVLFGIRFSYIAGLNVGSIYPLEHLPVTYFGVTGMQPNGNGNGVIRMQAWFYDKYTTGDYAKDYRGEFSFLTKWPKWGSPTNMQLCYPNVKNLATETVENGFPYLGKYKDPTSKEPGNHGNDMFYLRLAEIYLIKAEAENELNGPTASALSAFNKLRQRARNANGIPRTQPYDITAADVPTKEDFRMKIYDERSLELLGESHAFFDNVRMRYKDNKRTMMEYINNDFIKTIPNGFPTYNAATKTWGGGRAYAATYNWDPRLLLLPVPIQEMNANPAMQGDQNPGW